MAVAYEPIIKAVAGVMRGHLEQIGDRLRGIDKRLDEMKTTLADAHRGSYKEGIKYFRGDLSTHQGALWLCLSDTGSRPGTDGDWRLIVKSHR